MAILHHRCPGWHYNGEPPEKYEHDNCQSMRTFLDSACSFSWRVIVKKFAKGCFTICGDLHCDIEKPELDFFTTFADTERLLYKSKSRKVRDECRAYVVQCRLKHAFATQADFPCPFAVKRLPPADAAQGNHEANIMALLSFPHISALLGTFEYQAQLHIISYPAGCCDLGDFMHCISENLKGRAWTDRKDRPEPPKNPAYQEKDTLYHWIFEMELARQLQMLQRYFVCLCQALKYLHETSIRHRDIKPENVIIDIFGNVFFTDFGISQRYDNPDLASRGDKVAMTRKYQPPEVFMGQERSKGSDVWSLACVFVEMVTLLYGKPLDELEKACIPERSEYCTAIDELKTWLDTLSQRQPHKAVSGQNIEMCLGTIKKMLSNMPRDRPDSGSLWKAFDFPHQGRCPDCHPDHENAWLKHASKAQREKRDQARDQAEQFVENQFSGHQHPQGQTEVSAHLSPPIATKRGPEVVRKKPSSILKSKSPQQDSKYPFSAPSMSPGFDSSAPDLTLPSSSQDEHSRSILRKWVRERRGSSQSSKRAHFGPAMNSKTPPPPPTIVADSPDRSRPGSPATISTHLRQVPETSLAGPGVDDGIGSVPSLRGSGRTAETRPVLAEVRNPPETNQGESFSSTGTVVLRRSPSTDDMPATQPVLLLDPRAVRPWQVCTYDEIMNYCDSGDSDSIVLLKLAKDKDEYEILSDGKPIRIFNLSALPADSRELARKHGIYLVVRTPAAEAKIVLRDARKQKALAQATQALTKAKS